MEDCPRWRQDRACDGVGLRLSLEAACKSTEPANDQFFGFHEGSSKPRISRNQRLGRYQFGSSISLAILQCLRVVVSDQNAISESRTFAINRNYRRCNAQR